MLLCWVIMYKTIIIHILFFCKGVQTIMKYPRPAYLEPGMSIEKTTQLYGGGEISVPIFQTPISPAENFRRAARRERPLWVPNTLSDLQTLWKTELCPTRVRGMQFGPEFRNPPKEQSVFRDWFNASWTWVPSAGGEMLTPGTKLLDDITKWESVIEFPVLDQWDFEGPATNFMRNLHNPAKALRLDIGHGCTERLVSLLGGYTEGMLALAVEPEAVKDFLGRFAEHIIALFDLLYSLYPIDMLTYHDDWGTERDTFFSAKMLEDIVLEPTRKIVEHVRSKGVMFELHSCGNIERFLPYIVELNVEFLQIQRRAVNIPKMKERYGDKIGFNTGVEGLLPGDDVPLEELLAMIRKTVDLYGKGGGFYAILFDREPERIWASISELYAYSREFYDIPDEGTVHAS